MKLSTKNKTNAHIRHIMRLRGPEHFYDQKINTVNGFTKTYSNTHKKHLYIN